MKKGLTISVFIGLATLILFSGCQAGTPDVQTPSGAATQTVAPLIPYSRGPSSPITVHGPSTPPPGAANISTQQAPQAVSETEMVKYSIK